jgi:hypothetical protein
MSEPRVKEVAVAVSVGGKVQLVKYEQQADYSFGLTRTYEVDMTEAEASEFEARVMHDLRLEVEPHADGEYQKLLDARTQLNS